jgi:hypothetical protein
LAAGRYEALGVESDNLSSAFYFTGKNINPERIRNITKGYNGYKYTKILKREQWVRYLERNRHQKPTSKQDQEKLFAWIVNSTRIAPDELQTIITSMTTLNRIS